MSLLIFIGLLIILTLVPIALQNTYSNLPLKELKRRAAGGDNLAQTLHDAAAFGGSLYLFLWGIAGLAAAIFMMIMVRNLPTWGALACIVALLIIAFGWLPRSRPGPISRQLTRSLTPVVSWLLHYVHPLLSRVSSLDNLYQSKSQHLDIYEKQDLLDVLTEQKTASHNRIEEQELDLAIQSLSIGDKIIRDFMTPLRKARTVNAKDATGPVLIDELHKTGQTVFPVVEGKDKVVGLLFLNDLMSIIKHQDATTVKDVMQNNISYVHEDQSLNEVLNAAGKTGQPMFIVVNGFKDSVGVITAQDVINQFLGESAEEFDEYQDVEAVVNRAKKQAEEPEPEPEVIEAENEEEPADQELDDQEQEAGAIAEDTELAPESAETEVESGNDEPKLTKVKEDDIDETIEV